MAREMGPVLKRCRSLGIEPSVIGIDKKSNRTNARAGKKVLMIDADPQGSMTISLGCVKWNI